MPRETPRPPLPDGVKARPRRVGKARKRGQNRKHRPLTPKQTQRLRAYLNQSDDRTAAILGGSMLENELALLIMSRLRRLTRAEHTRVFDREGAPLWTFHDKIEMGYALRLYGPAIRDELHRIRRIRNKFAHHLSVRKFGSPQLKDEMDALQGAHWVYWFTAEEEDRPSTKAFVFARSLIDLQVRFERERKTPRPPPLATYRWHDRSREAFDKKCAKQPVRLIRRQGQSRKARAPQRESPQGELPL
jgi:hypothetical protein